MESIKNNGSLQKKPGNRLSQYLSVSCTYTKNHQLNSIHSSTIVTFRGKAEQRELGQKQKEVWNELLAINSRFFKKPFQSFETHPFTDISTWFFIGRKKSRAMILDTHWVYKESMPSSSEISWDTSILHTQTSRDAAILSLVARRVVFWHLPSV
jgi:hypothetical protein